ncbi:hypothetical protein [Epilithonimonas sp.]|uniref:hypothetical protein n=1 Tax=Epilithonimonas sp. TaxID=2894511 RepID=UPI0035B05045
MKLKDLPINQKVEINVHHYIYQGIKPRDTDGKGARKYFVFYSEKLQTEKLFMESAGNKIEFKHKEGHLIL